MIYFGLLDRLRAYIDMISGSPEKELLRRKEKTSHRKDNEFSVEFKLSDTGAGKKLSLLLDALRESIYRVSGSAEKGAESAEKGFRGRVFEALGAKIADGEKKVLRFSNRRVIFLTSTAVVMMIVVFYSFTSWSVGYTSSEKFCTGCHEMMNSYRDWKTSSHYDNKAGVVASCADCHLPTDMLSKIKVKIITGARDTFVHYLGDPEGLDFKELARKARENITDDSCIKCHKNPFPSHIAKGGLIAHRALQRGDVKKKCVDCHKNFVHTQYSP